MAQSQRYHQLERRLNELRNRFLPAAFSPTGDYTDEELDLARAYRVLVHAEMEHYFEERCLELAQKAFDVWRTNLRASRTLASFLVNVIGERKGLPKSLGTDKTIVALAGEVFGQYRHAISQNHGIKSENVLKILLPVGIDEADIDSTWLLTLDGFGAKRGLTAHAASVTYTIDPRDDFNTVKLIIAGIRDIDTAISRLKGAIKQV